jgi:hypothetical protein
VGGQTAWPTAAASQRSRSATRLRSLPVWRESVILTDSNCPRYHHAPASAYAHTRPDGSTDRPRPAPGAHGRDLSSSGWSRATRDDDRRRAAEDENLVRTPMTSPDIVTLDGWAPPSGLFKPLARRCRNGHRHLADTDFSDRLEEIDVRAVLIGRPLDERVPPALHAPLVAEREFAASAIGDFVGRSAHA